MRPIRIFILLVIFIILLSCLANAQTHILPLSRLGHDMDIVVKGAQVTHNVTFPLPAGSLLPGSFLQLTVEPAQYLNGTGSFAFFLNDQPALSTSVAKLRAAPTVRIPLPANVMHEKALRLAIKSNVFVTDNICTDYRRGQLFYVLRNSSGMTLQFTPAPVTTIPDFFRSLYAGLMVVIPDKPTAGELTAGAWAYGVMQKTFPYYPVQIIRASERDKYPSTPRLWIGTKDHLPQVLVNGEADIHLPFANALVITGKDEDALKHNTRNLEKLLRLNVLPAVSADAAKAKPDPTNPKDLIRFGSNSVQEGILIVPMDFHLYPGQLATLPKGLGIRLEGRYSVHIRPEHSVRFDVYFNRNLIHSELLDHSGHLKRDIALPKHLPLKARNTLSAEFHYPEIDGSCDIQGPVQTAQMYYTSYFLGTGKAAVDAYSWDSIGMTFLRDGLIALDDLGAAESPAIAARLALLVNRQLPEDKYAFPEFANLSELKERQFENYLIVAGLAENLPQELQDSLPIKPGSARTAITQEDSSILYNHRINSNTVIGQIGVFRKAPLAVFSANSSRQSLNTLLDQLNSSAGSAQLSGTILIYNAPTSLTFLDSRDPHAGMPQPGIMATLRDAWERANRFVEQYPKAVFLIVAVLLSILLLRLYLGHLRRKRQ